MQISKSAKRRAQRKASRIRESKPAIKQLSIEEINAKIVRMPTIAELLR